MAVSALHQSLVHLVMEGHGELRLDVRVALEAQRGLRRLQKGLIIAGVNAMAANAAYIALAVSRALKVLMLALVASQAILVNLFGCSLGWVEDLGYVAATLHMQTARAVAAFAGSAFVAVQLGQIGVRIGGKAFRHLIVARCAGFSTHIIRGRDVLDLRSGRLIAGRR